MRRVRDKQDLKRLRPGQRARIRPRFAKELLKTCDIQGHGTCVSNKPGMCGGLGYMGEEFQLICKVNGEIRRFNLSDVGGEEIYVVDGREQIVEFMPEGLPEVRPPHQRRRRPRRY